MKNEWRTHWSTLVLPSALGPKIPPELFDCILSFIGTWLDGAPVSFTKRELARCALVCKRWALLCQPKVYWQILLFKPEDVNYLRRMIDQSANKSLRNDIHRMDVHGVHILKVSEISTPWFHRVP